ncbi:hypothetical protein C2862_09110 [Massilia sp. Mn16-1_5]|nr:hypothetical protein C2862_09110 [Massilia sp. Mn16-1_5]
MLLASGTVLADDLSEANKFLAAQQYDKALPLYTRLANAGNAEAQFRVGEMAWYGDGMRQDLQAAHAWFTKAAAGGSADAREALAALDRRRTRGAEIGYWTRGYRGEDLRSDRFECKMPAVPAVSTSNADVAATRASIEAWQTCYNGFVANFNATAPLAKRIPADVLDMMTPKETERARKHIESVYRTVLTEAQCDVVAVRTAQAAWETATERFVKEENVRMKRKLDVETRLIVDSQRRNNDYAAMNYRGLPPPPSAVRTTK